MQPEIVVHIVIWTGAIGVILGYWWGLHTMKREADKNSGLRG